MTHQKDNTEEMGLVLYGQRTVFIGDEETVTQIPEPREANVLNAPEARKLLTRTLSTESLPARLQLVVRESGEIIECIPHTTLILGRRNSSLPVDVDLSNAQAQDLGVSRNHARIEPVNNGLLVRDLQTVNGSFLNGARMHPMQAYELHNGDELKLGRVHLKVHFIYERNHR